MNEEPLEAGSYGKNECPNDLRDSICAHPIDGDRNQIAGSAVGVGKQLKNNGVHGWNSGFSAKEKRPREKTKSQNLASQR